LILGVGILLYAALTLTLVSVAVVLFATMAVLIVAGIVELIYGIMLLSFFFGAIALCFCNSKAKSRSQ